MPPHESRGAGAPVLHVLPGAADALSLVRRLTRPGEPALLMDSCPEAAVTPADRELREWSFLAAAPRAVVTVKDGRAWRRDGDGAWEAWPAVTDPFEAARALLADVPALAPGADAVPFPAGVAGFLSYDAGRAIERLPESAVDDARVPDAFLLLVDAVVTVHHPTGRAWIAAAPTPDGDRAALTLLDRAKSDPRPLGAGDVPSPSPTLPREAFERIVARAREHVRAGDVFQVNLSHRLDAPADPGVDPLALYARLRDANAAPMAGVLLTGDLPEGGEVNVLSSSPERLFALDADGVLDARPIAGTRPRGRSREEDEALAAELRGDEKENAEHVMLVDLARNDVGRVAAYGSVRVPRLLDVESYARVHHLVSTVKGRLAVGRDGVDATRALFPGGTITGAPKVRAMEIIEDLEPVRRGAYTGGFGYWSATGAADWNILIRTLVHLKGRAHGDRVSLQVGAGIVWDSDPAREWGETLAKADALLNAFRDPEQEGEARVADRVV